jgi:HAD superfamily hydrolase (TIGR01509 family)
MDIKAVIFDLDGVLIDTEPLHALADIRILNESGIHPPGDYFDRFVGWTNKAMWDQIKKEYPLTVGYEELTERQMTLKLSLLKETDFEPISGIPELLEFLKKMKIPLAIASSSPRQFIEAVTEKLGISGYFTILMSGDEVERSKPEPDIFLKVADFLRMNPSDCLVIEDSESGTIAAKRAGMKCIGYRNENSGQQDLSKADLIVDAIDRADILSFLSSDEPQI